MKFNDEVARSTCLKECEDRHRAALLQPDIRRPQTFPPWDKVQSITTESRDLDSGSDQEIYQKDILEGRILKEGDLDVLGTTFRDGLGTTLRDDPLSNEEMRYKAFIPFTQKHMYISDEAFMNLNQVWMPMAEMGVISHPQYKWDVVEVNGGKYLQATQFIKKSVTKLGEVAPRTDFAYDDVTSVLFDEKFNVVNIVKMPGYLYATQQVSPAASPISVMGMDTHTSSSDQELKQVGHILDLARERALCSDLDKLIMILQDGGMEVEQRRDIYVQLLLKELDMAYALQTEATPKDGSVVDPNGAQGAYERWINKVTPMQPAGPEAEAHQQLQRWLGLIVQKRHDVEMILASPEKQKIIDETFAQLQKRREGLQTRASVDVHPARSVPRSAAQMFKGVARMLAATVRLNHQRSKSAASSRRESSLEPGGNGSPGKR